MASRKAWNYERALKEIAHCRDHSSQSFQMQRNKDLQTWNLCQPLNTIESKDLKPLSQRNPQTIILDIWSWKTSHCRLASSETHRPFTEVIEFLRSLVLPSWLDWSSAQHFNCLTFFDRCLLQYVMSFSWSNLIEALPMWRLKQKQMIHWPHCFSVCGKIVWTWDHCYILWYTGQ